MVLVGKSSHVDVFAGLVDVVSFGGDGLVQQNVILNEDTLKNDMNGLKVNYVILPAESDLPSHFPVDYMNPVEHTKHYEIYKWNGF